MDDRTGFPKHRPHLAAKHAVPRRNAHMGGTYSERLTSAWPFHGAGRKPAVVLAFSLYIPFLLLKAYQNAQFITNEARFWGPFSFFFAGLHLCRKQVLSAMGCDGVVATCGGMWVFFLRLLYKFFRRDK